jgi:predicted kinase
MFLCQLSGIPGAGKSFMAKKIAALFPAAILDLDVVKTSIMTSFDDGIDFKFAGKVAYDVIFSLADHHLGCGLSVVIDTPCAYPAIPQRGRAIAARHGAAYKMMECSVRDVAVINHRRSSRPILKSQSRTHGISQMEFEAEMAGMLRPEGVEILSVDTQYPVDEKEIMDYLCR